MVYVTCPHCNTKFEDEPDSYNDGDENETHCPKCEKLFGYTISISIDTISFELPCGGQDGPGPHKWKHVVGSPRERYQGMYYCSHCGLEIKRCKETEYMFQEVIDA